MDHFLSIAVGLYTAVAVFTIAVRAFALYFFFCHDDEFVFIYIDGK